MQGRDRETHHAIDAYMNTDLPVQTKRIKAILAISYFVACIRERIAVLNSVLTKTIQDSPLILAFCQLPGLVGGSGSLPPQPLAWTMPNVQRLTEKYRYGYPVLEVDALARRVELPELRTGR